MADIIIQGIQYDVKSSFERGASLAPPLIRQALHSGSMNLYTEDGNSINQDYIIDKGDFKIHDYIEIEKISSQHIEKNSKLFSLGGDHSVTYPIVKALQKVYSKIDILHIDAHADLYHEYEGDPYSHACPFARIMEEGLAQNLVQVGIRTLNPHQADQAKKYNVEIHEMKNLDLTKVPTFENPLYISLDMDAFDPAFAPGVSHHEPGGLSSRQVLDVIQNANGPVIGADIVEYNPNRDFQNMTAYLAAKMMKELIGRMIEQ